ncbi:MAG: AsmA family protein [Alphaproteobacteria bacterium]|nr:AsmA family protein [Alphaproteobacteria bacterium]
MLFRKYSWIIKTILILLIGFIATVAVVISRIDLESLKENIVETLRHATNMPIEIDGKMSWKMSIKPQIEVNDIKIPNANWAKHKNLFVAEKIIVNFNLVSLFNSKPAIQNIKMYNVNTFVEKNSQGKISVVYIDRDKQKTHENKEVKKYPVERLGIEAIELYNVKVDLFGKQYKLTSFGLANYLKKKDLVFSGWIKPKEKLFPFVVNFSSIDKDTNQYPMTVAVSTGADALIADVHLNGNNFIPDKFLVHGEIPYADSIKKWLNIKNTFKIPVIKMYVDGNIEGNQINFDNSYITLDKSTMKFSGSYNWKNKKLDKAKLNIDNIDIYNGALRVFGNSEWVHPDRDLNAFKDMPLYGKILKQYIANIDVNINKFVVYRSLTLSNIKAKINLNKSNLKIKADTDIASGNINLALLANIDQKGIYDFKAAATGRNVKVGDVLHQININSIMSELPVNIELYLQANGENMSEVMQTLTGPVQVYSVDSGVADAELVKYMYGADFLTSLKNGVEDLFSTDKKHDLIPIKCTTANLKIRDGLIEIGNGVAIETNAINLRIAGSLNLGLENMDLSLVTVPVKGLKLSLTKNLVNSLQIQGNLSEPDVSINGAAFVGKMASAAGIGILLAPITGGLSLVGGAIAGLLAGNLLDGWLSDTQPCRTAMEEGAPALSQDPDWLSMPVEGLASSFLEHWRI